MTLELAPRVAQVSKNSIRDARTPQPGEIFSTPRDIEVVKQYTDWDTFRAVSVSK